MAALGTRARRTAFRSSRNSLTVPATPIGAATTPLRSSSTSTNTGCGRSATCGSRPPAPCSPPPQRWSPMRQRDNSARSWTTCSTRHSGCPAQARPAQADPPESCRPVPVLRRRPDPQGAATERPACPAGAPGLLGPMPDADLMSDELRAAIVLFASLLDERQRRLYAGLESLKCGWGGDTRIAGLLGIDPGTVARGRKQLLAQDVERRRVRRPGGGRPPKKNPRGDRCHRSGLAARCRRRSHHRYPLDAPYHREAFGGTRYPRHPGAGPWVLKALDYRCASTTSASRQAPAQTATNSSPTSRAARQVRSTRPADCQHRYQEARAGG